MRKLTTGILKDRLMAILMRNGLLNEKQYAFTPGQNIMVPALIRRLLLEHANNEQREMHVIDVDLTQGYDTVERWTKDMALIRMGVPAEYREYLAMLDRHNENRVITPYGLTNKFHAEAAALSQGGDDSPLP